jgi:MSHA biogenesis protein MshP
MKFQRGFAIVSAIFILVVLSVLGAAMVTLSTSQHLGSAQDVQGVRAYLAARSGAEWGMYQVQSTAAYAFSYGDGSTTPLAVGVANPDLRRCPGAADSVTATIDSFQPAATTMNGLVVTVRCTPHTDASGGPRVYELQSTACSEPNAAWTAITVACPKTDAAPGSMYVERRLSVVF